MIHKAQAYTDAFEVNNEYCFTRFKDNGLYAVTYFEAMSRNSEGKTMWHRPSDWRISVPSGKGKRYDLNRTVQIVPTNQGFQTKDYSFENGCLTGIAGEFNGVNVMHVGYIYDDYYFPQTTLLWLAIGIPVGVVLLCIIGCMVYCCMSRAKSPDPAQMGEAPVQTLDNSNSRQMAGGSLEMAN